MPNASSPTRAPRPTAARPTTARPTAVRVARVAGLLALVAVVLLFPSLAADPFILSVGVVILSYAVLATSWNLVGGFTGYISLGHAAYSGLGGYATALLILRTGMDPWLALIAGGLIVAAIAIPVGIASLRVRGASFVITSIALVLILQLTFQSWHTFTGGSNGLRVPRPFGTEVLRPEQHERFFYLHAVLLALALLTWWLIERSRLGAGLKAIREDEDKAQALGVPTFAYKLTALVISAFFTALGGGLYALWFGYLDPIFQFSILVGTYMVLMALLGGVRSLFGPLLGAVVVGYAVEVFKSQYGDTQLHLVATGVLLGLVVLFMPDGVIPALSSLLNRRRGAASIREVSAEELAKQREEAAR
ncbi:branched-chain amino acid ABC transporter permease [Promicromonospora iranensis]|uniref:Branched-chain amino acid transport system permease protein n=1 Tax=Promicromonospora iranensis TaxID=1105144 RepID=A0ABU2CI12_9MICO|nr:branched-chain amino acid ABC transporter permease [Promicromonospora iranensis]MDR7380969.1 branched-chain amino acid transport system permease protein [Promicromonospora iranensis]